VQREHEPKVGEPHVSTDQNPPVQSRRLPSAPGTFAQSSTTFSETDSTGAIKDDAAARPLTVDPAS
jgi:hypothetical protein